MNDYDRELAGAWGAPPTVAPSSEPTVQSALAKEKALKEIISLRDGLRGLLVRITEVEGETDKLKKDNDFLGTYIDNLTRNTVVAAGHKR
ncbi:hypothetical protein CC85DRAFT_285195 [Cutaneotrichosporon oleaginosum]|uniref:Uncharacterized protein n=1 Tax=Cutaneotrichosporon oleaginosum TaxID=879819 RepID=A0A0J0XNX5_9TREE|nr:uncharacterized protein CC85DRAFT_285195 [Cutaneotrichosporon oleaginosum]KLT42851.1 hypothetical protein CC85DRAFT_285195 [Cutaneotrichosporon oleaginosum]TXT08184.1 hypothetical protein COLE_05108 [Cutaneotrichosporon oleaginosum]